MKNKEKKENKINNKNNKNNKNNRNNKNNSVKECLLHVIRKNKGLTALLGIVVLAVVGCSLIPPQILRVIVDVYLTQDTQKGLLKIALVYFGVLGFIGIFDFVKEGLLTILGQKIIKNIRIEMMKKAERISSEYYAANESGMVVSRFTNDVESIQLLFTNGVVSMAIDILKITGILISIWFFSQKLGIMVVLLIPLIYIITRSFQKRMLKAQMKNRQLIAKVNNHIPESIGNITMIQSFSKEKYMEERYKTYLLENFHSMEKVNFYDSIFSPIILMIRAFSIALMVLLCSGETAFLGISIGMTAAAMELISNIFSPIENLGMELQSIQQAAAGVKRVNEFFQEKEDKKKSTGIKGEEIRENGPNLMFDKVSFSYQPQHPLLEDVTLRIKEKEKVTVTGRTGAGKSTLFKLILGLLEADCGKICFGKYDVTQIPNGEKRKFFGYVEQNFRFVEGDILRQITLGDPSITREQVERAMKFVGLHEYIEEFEEQYYTQAEEYLFSQGQRQLLSIARAIVMDPPILLLDEITANLDGETEKKIIEVLLSASEERMLLSISHRMSAVLKDCRVLSLEDGKLIEKTKE
ncbi:MAG: ABC transporter ATP-binding protein [Acetivibrio sp.]